MELNTEIKHSKPQKTLVVYGTNSGNAELVAQAIQDGLCEVGLETDLKRAERTNAAEAAGYDMVIMISSTWDVGKLNNHFVAFYSDLNKSINPETKESPFKNKYIEVVGLGDSEHYDIFCGAADILKELVKKLGGIQLMGTVRIDGPPHAKLHDYKEWGKTLAAKFSP